MSNATDFCSKAARANIVYARGFLKFAVYANCDKFNPPSKSMRFLNLFALFAVLAALSAVVVAQDKNTGTIKGKVKVEKGSAAGVAVILRKDDHEVRRGELIEKASSRWRACPRELMG